MLSVAFCQNMGFTNDLIKQESFFSLMYEPAFIFVYHNKFILHCIYYLSWLYVSMPHASILHLTCDNKELAPNLCD